MRQTLLAAVLLLALPGAALAQSAPAAYIGAALADPARQADAANDERRQLAAVLAFTELKPGQSVLELIPGGGYFTKVFSGVVGAQGHVYAVWPTEYAKEASGDTEKLKALVAQPHYANVALLVQPAAEVSTPQPVDLVFTSQNYHDYPDPFMGKLDLAQLNRQVFAALKPGGLFVVIDHVAPAGSGLADTDTLHRIDPALVKREIEAAGFVFDGESQVLRNPNDPHTAKVFDPAIRGHTDQFVYRFRKPAG